MNISLMCCTDTLMAEIADKRFKRINVARTYALAIRSTEKTDWAKVNAAIVKRWSRSGLEWIKKQAWSGKCFKSHPSSKEGEINETGN